MVLVPIWFAAGLPRGTGGEESPELFQRSQLQPGLGGGQAITPGVAEPGGERLPLPLRLAPEAFALGLVY